MMELLKLNIANIQLKFSGKIQPFVAQCFHPRVKNDIKSVCQFYWILYFQVVQYRSSNRIEIELGKMHFSENNK